MGNKQRIKGRVLLEEMRSGKSPGEILTRLGLCLAKLSPIFDRLVEKGLASREEVKAWKKSWADSCELDTFLCPKCGKPQFGSLIECLDCYATVEVTEGGSVLIEHERSV
jgi:hypothetical protein